MATLRDINQRSVSFFKGQQSDYVGIDDPKLEAMVLQWRRTLDAKQNSKQISADIQRLIADQLDWVNVTGYPFFQAYRDDVKNYPFYMSRLWCCSNRYGWTNDALVLASGRGF